MACLLWVCVCMCVCVHAHTHRISKAQGKGTENSYTEHFSVHDNQSHWVHSYIFLNNIWLLTNGNNWLCFTKARYWDTHVFCALQRSWIVLTLQVLYRHKKQLVISFVLTLLILSVSKQTNTKVLLPEQIIAVGKTL